MNLQGIADLTPIELSRLVQQIGNTPLDSIYLVINGSVRKVHLKLESSNPTGSVKDRTGYALIRSLEERGVVTKGSVVIESTSGNLGVALSLICKARGYGFVAVVDPKTTQENINTMQVLGATIDMVHQPDVNGGYLLSRLKRVQELCQSESKYIWADQYSNPANPHIHFACTGPEIYQQMHGKVDALFAAVSTGGTLAGVGRFFREASPSTRIIGVDARGSVVFGTPPAPRRLTGIGSSRISSFLNEALYDTHILVGDEEAFTFCRALASATGIRLGGSSGAVLAACVQYLVAYPDIEDVVCVCADHGDNYASSIFNDEWMQQQELHLSLGQREAVQEIVPTRSRVR
jgi:2,3-diaminopropionate biosynthesis protein SbnA